MFIRSKRPLTKRPAFILLILLSLFLTACGTGVSNTNWPGLTADGDIVYVAYGTNILAYDVIANDVVWTFPDPENAQSTLFYYAAPSISDNQIIAGDYGVSGGFFSPGVIVSIYGLDQNGNLSWPQPQSELASDSIVAPPLQANDRVYIGTADGSLLALDPSSGEPIDGWQFEAGHSIWGQPSFQNNLLYVASLDKTIYALDPNSGDVVWQQSLGGAAPGKVVVGADLVYVGSFDSRVHAFDATSGDPQWTTEMAGDWVWGTPTLADDHLYYGDILGNVYAVDAQTGEQVWQEEVDGAVQTSPTIHNGVVYVASEGNLETNVGSLTAFAADSGNQLWQEDTVGALYTTPVVAGDMLIVAPFNNEELLLIGYDFDGNELWTLAPPAQ
ncbi:MAG: PQQ-binding-like beta-propeller repeat protein [Chloroflexota bacterium]